LLEGFARESWMLDADAGFMPANAAGELTRFLQYGSAPIYPVARVATRELLAAYPMTGRGSGVWVATAVGADYYDDCGLYGICDFRPRLSQKVLPTEHACGATLTIRAQEMSDGQLMASCDSLAEEEGRFHELLQTAGNPVPGDRNDRLEIVVFNDPEQYQEDSYALFGNSTANGGICLQRAPAD